MTEVSEPFIDPLLGATVGTYAVEERIGEGGMAVVYRAREPGSPRPIALKVFQRSWAQDARVVRRFVREARIASALANPNTVTIHDFGEAEGGILYIAMELLEGRPLREYLVEHKALSPALAAEVAAQICRSLVDAHEHGIVHRDLKPDNVYLTLGAGGALVCKVLDYGVARVVSTDAAVPAYTVLTQIGTIVGTPAYMSPEQARAEEIDVRTDLYSLGVMLFEMLQGFLPFYDKNPIRLLEAQKTEPAPELLDAPALLGELVARLLAKSADDRPASAAQVLTVLEAYLATTSPLDRRVPEGDIVSDVRADGTDRITTQGGSAAKDELETVPAVRRGNTPQPERAVASSSPAPPPSALPLPLTRAQVPGPPGLSSPRLLDVPPSSPVVPRSSPSRTGPAAAALILAVGIAASIAIAWSQRSTSRPRSVPATGSPTAQDRAPTPSPTPEDRDPTPSPTPEDPTPTPPTSPTVDDLDPSPSPTAEDPPPSPSPTVEDRGLPLAPSAEDQTGEPRAPDPAVDEWSGSFRTQEGWLRLTQSGDRVTGLFGVGGRMGRLWGRIEGGAIEFRWVVRGGADGEDEQGRGRARRTTTDDGTLRLTASLGSGDAVTGYASWTLRPDLSEPHR